MTSEPF